MINPKDEDGGRKIEVETEDLDIAIKLKKITPKSKCTKIKVTASKDVVMRDKATSAEIIYQTEKTAELMKIR